MNTNKNTSVINRAQSGIVKTGFGKLWGVAINSHTSGTMKIIDGTESGVAATAVLTSSGACAPATHAVTELVSSGAMVAATHAVSVMTGNAIVATNTVTIGTTVYTFVNEFTSNPTVGYQVLVGATLTITLANLVKAINAVSGGVGTAYSTGTVAHPDVVAVTSDATTMTVRGRVPGTTLNTVVTTGTAVRISWADTTLGGGTGASDAGVTSAAATFTIGSITYMIVDALSETYGATAIPYQILKGASEAIMLDNIKLAVNGTGTAGTQYSTGTVAHTLVVATTNTDTVQTFRSRTPGTGNNTLATTETMANTAFADTTLGGGTGNSDAGITTAAATFTINGRVYTAVVELSESLGAAAIADQILWVTSEAVFLDNVKKAINATGIAGTDYSTGTLQNVDVIATTNTDTAQTIQSKYLGSASNSMAVSTTLANYAWGAATLTSGTGATGKVMHNTMTFAAGPNFIDFQGESFDTGLYIDIAATVVDYSVEVE